MSYRGTRIDGLIAEGNGRLVAADGMGLSPDRFTVPIATEELMRQLAGELGLPHGDPEVTRQVGQRYLPVSMSHGVPRQAARSAGLVARDAAHHPRGHHHQVNAGTRIVAHLTEYPSWIAAQFSAAALLGITDFADGADSAVLNNNRLRISRGVRQPTQRQYRGRWTPWTLRLGEQELKVTPPMLTLAHCLRAVLDGEHAWETPADLGHPPHTVRAVQLIDRYRREFGLDEEQVLEALHGLVNQRRLENLLQLSDPGADSPPETILRLAADRATKDLGIDWQAQVPVYRNGRVGAPGSRDPGQTLFTVIDLAAPSRRLALYYDGEHHLERGQRDQDSLITAQLAAWGWRSLRVTAGMLRDVRQLNFFISSLVFPQSRSA
ncbi:hypothetical protein EAH68_05990 [Corynebacterium hylobatis]|uniref:DUF559 domain-containing protein n=1 Tax=Corynebacterium hylobatis TaxID=1859290 RepID=A0A3S0BI04_9CORY|nr:hypothetical protein [Corynebacterium hylobatis]RSZ63787.1 hypothetical protein EAH68_05990 [Corynebacterium hylobatis]